MNLRYTCALEGNNRPRICVNASVPRDYGRLFNCVFDAHRFELRVNQDRTVDLLQGDDETPIRVGLDATTDSYDVRH